MISKNEMRKMKEFLGLIPLEDIEEDIDMEPVRIEKHGRTTVVFWADGTATAVRRQAEDEDNEYAAFCAAVTKRVYGSNSQIKSIIQKMTIRPSAWVESLQELKKTAADAMCEIEKAFQKLAESTGGVTPKQKDACPINKHCKAEHSAMEHELGSLNDLARKQYEDFQKQNTAKDEWTCPNCGKSYPWKTGHKGRFAFCFKCNTAAQLETQQ